MSDAKVMQRHYDTAKQFVHDYNVRDVFQSREGPIEDLADTIARARAEGAASEREHCAAVADRWANSTSCRHHDDLPCCHVRTGVAIAAAIRARSEGGKA